MYTYAMMVPSKEHSRKAERHGTHMNTATHNTQTKEIKPGTIRGIEHAARYAFEDVDYTDVEIILLEAEWFDGANDHTIHFGGAYSGKPANAPKYNGTERGVFNGLYDTNTQHVYGLSNFQRL